MKVLLINKYFYRRAGAETVFFHEHKFLLDHGHKVGEFSMHHPQNLDSPFSEYFVNNIEYRGRKTIRSVINYPLVAIKFISNVEAVRNLKKLLSIHHFEIAHLHNVYHQLTPSIIPLLKDHGIKVVLTLHDYKVVCPNYKMLRNGSVCSACLNGNYLNCLINRCEDGSISKSFLLTLEALWHKMFNTYRGVDIFIAPSEFHASQIEKGGIPFEKIRVLPNGVEDPLPSDIGIDKGYILYFGRISIEKGLLTLLRAYSRANVDMPLKIVGTGPLFEDVVKNYKNIQFLGYKSGDKLRALISASSFVVVPSEWYENCSMSVLEALSYGKPVIGSNVGGIPEQIEQGKNGLLFQMGDEIELAEQIRVLANDISLRHQLGISARLRHLEKYTLKRHCGELISLYNEVLSL